MGGGFGFGMLLDVQMLGFYQAQHHGSNKHFLAYVLQVSTANSQFLIYRRYSQIANLAAKIHFHPSVGLPPKYALQVFPLTEMQVQQRFEGLRAFIHDVFAQLCRQHEEGMHHDVTSSAGLDMQIFYDFISHHRNRPPQPVHTLPEWATPTIDHHHGTMQSGSSYFPYSPGSEAISRQGSRTSMWHDADSVTDSEDVGEGLIAGEKLFPEEDDRSSHFRNEILQAEGKVNALWNCVRAYMQATKAWWSAADAVMDEYKRIGDMSLFKHQDVHLGSPSSSSSPLSSPQDMASSVHPFRLATAHNQMVDALQADFEKLCEERILKPLEALTQDVLPEVKHSYWTRFANLPSDTGDGDQPWQAENINIRRLMRERETLHKKIRKDVQESMTTLVKLQNEVLEKMRANLNPFETPRDSTERSDKKDHRDNSEDVESSHPGRDEETCEENEDQILQNDTTQEVATTFEECNSNISIFDNNTNTGNIVNEAMTSIIEVVHEEQIQLQEEEEEVSRVWIWGRPPTTESGTPLILRPKRVTLLNGQSIVQVACGGEHVLYLTDTGDVYSYGDDEEKKKPLSRTASSNNFLAPRLVEEFALEKALHRTKIIKVSCGAQHSLGITDAGELYTWGSGEDGRLGHGDTRDRSVPRKVVSLLRDRVIHASCGGAHTAVLTDKHAIFTFGRGRNGRLGLGDNKWRDTPEEITSFPIGTTVVYVACGWNFTVALTRDGSVFSWGKQGEGQCGLGYLDKDQLVPRKVEKLMGSHVVDIACGYTHTLALTMKGEVFTWGLGEYGQLGRGIVYQPVPERVDFSSILCAPDRIGRVYCGAFHSIVTTEMRVMFAWGLNIYGACGLGHTANKDSPARIDCFLPKKDLIVACGHKYTVALEVDPAILRSSASHVNNSLTMTMTTTTSIQIDTNGHAELPAALNIAINSTPATEWSTTPTNREGRRSGDSTPNISYHTDPEARQTIHEKEEELRRAKKLWRTRILRDWEESKDTPLAHTMWRQGIPPSIRARVWPLAIGNKLKITPEMYKIYRKRAIAAKKERAAGVGINAIGREHTLALIDTDLPRTFPSLKLFDSSGPYYEYLLEVLETYACYRPDLGYIQGMSYLAAMLCLHMPQDRYLSFQCLANLMVHEHLFTFYLLDAELSGVYYMLFEEFLSARLPELHRHMTSIGISCSMYLMNWLQTLFLQVLPLELATRVFDNFLLDGTVFLFRTAIAIHELLQADLLRADIDEAMPMIQKNVLYEDLWYARVSEEELFRTISTVVVPSHIYSALDRVVNDVFFYEKRGNVVGGCEKMMALASGGQSIGIGRVKHERRRMYSISDTLNGVLGGF